VELLKTIAGLGFQAVELPIEDPSLVNAALLKPVLRDLGLRVHVCGAFGPGRDLTHADASVRENCREYLKACFQIAANWMPDLSLAPCIRKSARRVNSPRMNASASGTSPSPACGRFARDAAAHGLAIALEPINRFETDLVNTTADSLRMIREIDHPAAKVMIDSFHMTIEESDIAAAIRAAGKDLIHVQVSENHRGVTGTGLTPWVSFRDALREIQYEGSVVIESFTPDNRDLAGAVCIWKRFTPTQDEFAARGLAFLQQLFSQP
jgi:D-psicose/D-tagatose/L-ribulose 3-epimerase